MSEAASKTDRGGAVAVGRVVGVHSLRGELKVEPLTDFPERFERGATLWHGVAPRQVERSRWQANLVYLKLAGVDTRSEADALRGATLEVPEAHVIAAEGVYYEHDLVGLRVEDGAGADLGRLIEILRTGANDVYVVRGARGELLLPAVEDVIRRVDLGERVVVELLPGLEFRAAPRRREGGRPRTGGEA